MKKNKKIYALTIPILINVISSLIYSFFEKVNFFEVLLNSWKILFSYIYNLLNIKISLWIIIITILTFILIIKFINMLHREEKQSGNKSLPFMNYTSGTYKGILYAWNIENLGNTYYINKDSFRPLCDCKAELTHKSYHKNIYYSEDKLFCVNCDKIIDVLFNQEVFNHALLYFENNFKREIIDYNQSILKSESNY